MEKEGARPCYPDPEWVKLYGVQSSTPSELECSMVDGLSFTTSFTDGY
ncbi:MULTISPECIES: hypothetical protein [unclassified Algoriphagus]|nr:MULTISPECIES: hypothetical protein [unclassified Algoriphagus]QYH40772.1 hypothetical protein GYM62_18935 [Algoriphagus sp. NBT04N3]